MPVLAVQLDPEAAPEELEAVRSVFRSRGEAPEVRLLDLPRGVGPSREDEAVEEVGNRAVWLMVVLLAVPIGSFLKSLGTASGNRAGATDLEALASLVRDLRAARQSSEYPEGLIELRDPDGTVLLLGDPAAEAYQRLLDVDWSERRGGMLMWDEERGEWYDSDTNDG